MNNFIYENTTKVDFGRRCIQEYLQSLIQTYGNNVMIVYDETSYKQNRLYDDVGLLLKNTHLDILEFPNTSKNVTYTTVLKGARLAQENNIDLILGIGGSSVIDCCKAIALATHYTGDVWYDFWRHPGIFKEEPIPVGVIVTTLGLGSECNGKAMLYHEGLHIKVGRDYPQCQPKFALLDPFYTLNDSLNHTISTSFYSFCFMMTCFLNNNEDHVSDAMILGALKSTINILYQTLKNLKDYKIRSDLMWLSSLSNQGLFILGKQNDFECQHIVDQLSLYTSHDDGELLAAIYPTYCQMIYKKVPHKFEKLGIEVFNLSLEGVSQNKFILKTIDAIKQLIKDMGLDYHLEDLGNDELQQMINNWQHLPSCFRKMSDEDLYKLLKACR